MHVPSPNVVCHAAILISLLIFYLLFVLSCASTLKLAIFSSALSRLSGIVIRDAPFSLVFSVADNFW